MEKTNPREHLITSTRTVVSQARTRITAPHEEAAIVHINQADDLPMQLKVIRTSITHKIEPSQRSHP